MRTAGAAAYYRGRPPRADILLILFSLETFVVTGLIALSIASSDPAYGQLAESIFSTWVASIFVVLPSYLILLGLGEMRRGRSLLAVLLPVGLEFGFLVFLGTALLGASGSFTFSSFFDYLVSLHTPVVPPTKALSLLVPSVAAYCSLLVYSAVPTVSAAVQTRVALLLPLIGAAISLAWVYAAVLLLPDSLLSLTLPGLILVAVLWAYMRR